MLDVRESIPRERLPEELSRAHVFAAPSVYEAGPGFVYLEAMACGLPVIGCTGSGVGEVVHSCETGLLIPPSQPALLAEAIRDLLSNSAKREQMGKRAREFVVEQFDSELCLDRLGAYYREACERAGKKP